MSDRKEAERAAFERVFYPDSRVLVNELGLRDAASLDAAERLFTDTRIEEGMPAAAAEPTYAGFKAIHHHLFQDLYAWAGQERAAASDGNKLYQECRECFLYKNST